MAVFFLFIKLFCLFLFRTFDSVCMAIRNFIDEDGELWHYNDDDPEYMWRIPDIKDLIKLSSYIECCVFDENRIRSYELQLFNLN